VGVECGQSGRVGRRGAKADVSIGPHQKRARRGQAGTVEIARGVDDVYESAPAAAQALDVSIVRRAEEQEVVRCAREHRAIGIAVARARGGWRVHSRAEVLSD
jgi:hypothetical protein